VVREWCFTVHHTLDALEGVHAAPFTTCVRLPQYDGGNDGSAVLLERWTEARGLNQLCGPGSSGLA
jgi:hypothetical protein